MNVQQSGTELKTAVALAWNPDAATSNLDRWLSVCHREEWNFAPENLPLLIKLFGASWYFTRLIFFRGREITHCFETLDTFDFTSGRLLDELRAACADGDLEQELDRLRLRKNEIMLQIFLLELDARLSRENIELALTRLSEAVLQVMFELLIRERRYQGPAPAILAMGRMAGREMNYGSDLDLIFLYNADASSDNTSLIRQIQMLLRHIALPTPCGILYEIDMRLRPHGTSGTLISPVHYFIEYHHGQREVWERQMMTRCRPVYDPDHLAATALEKIKCDVYAEHDSEHLRTQIVNMRARVEQELGSPKDKFEVKRGAGGIMDIDFLCHYLQLLHGHDNSSLQVPSTRTALRELANLGCISTKARDDLLHAYNYLKTIEGVLRVHDMKNVNAFPRDPGAVSVVARALGELHADPEQSGRNFLHTYVDTTRQVRRYFSELVGDISLPMRC